MRVFLERETFVEFDLQLGRVRMAIFGARLLGVEEFQLPPVGLGDAGWREFIEPA